MLQEGSVELCLFLDELGKLTDSKSLSREDGRFLNFEIFVNSL